MIDSHLLDIIALSGVDAKSMKSEQLKGILLIIKHDYLQDADDDSTQWVATLSQNSAKEHLNVLSHLLLS